MIYGTLRSCKKIVGVKVEVIVVDYGSTNGMPELIERDFPDVRLFRLNCNSGSGSVPRNEGLAIAKGKYIKFLDHDDLIQPRGFRRECEEAMLSNADIVMARWGVVQVDAVGCFDRSEMKTISPPAPDRIREAILRGESVPFTGAALYKKSYIQDEAWDSTLSIIDDFDWFCRLAMMGGVITAVDSIAYYWPQHAGSSQARARQDGLFYKKISFERYRVYTKIERCLRDTSPLRADERRLLARRYYSFLKCFACYYRTECVALQKRIYRLDPGFVVDAACEPSRISLWLIRLMGLGSYLRIHALISALRRRLLWPRGAFVQR